MDTSQALSALSALSHETRLRAFRELVQAGPEGLSVGELRDRLGVPPATLSAYLNGLRAASLVSDQREGRVIRVRANYSQMNALLSYLTENCCAGAADCSPAACAPDIAPRSQVAAEMTGRKRVLFVCVENSNRSQMAEAFARMHGGKAVQAYSAGSRPSGAINPKAIRFMGELGYDLGSHQSKALEAIDGMEFDAVITMGCGDSCPWVPAKRREDWSLADPRGLDDAGYRSVRDDIAQRVQVLLDSL